MSDEPLPDELVSAVEQVSDWEVSDYEYSSGMYAPVTITVELEPSVVADGTSPSAFVKDVVSELEEEYEEGAPVHRVLVTLMDRSEMNVDEASDAIENLRRKGEVYEPRKDYLRTT